MHDLEQTLDFMRNARHYSRFIEREAKAWGYGRGSLQVGEKIWRGVEDPVRLSFVDCSFYLYVAEFVGEIDLRKK